MRRLLQLLFAPAVIALGLVPVALASPAAASGNPTQIVNEVVASGVPRFGGNALAPYGTTNLLRGYGEPASGILSPIGYVGFDPPLIRTRGPVVGSGPTAHQSDDVYVDDPGIGCFQLGLICQQYDLRIWLPEGTQAAAFGVASLQDVDRVHNMATPLKPWLHITLDSGLVKTKVMKVGDPRIDLIARTTTAPPGTVRYIDLNSNAPFDISHLSVSRSSSQPNAPGNYVAMGDSFSSGEGYAVQGYSMNANGDWQNYIPNDNQYETGTAQSGSSNYFSPDVPWGCHRGKAGWVNRLVNRLDLNRQFVACSGARTIDLLRSSHDHYAYQGPQFTALSPATKVVTMSMGINDVGFSGLMSDCVHTSGIGSGDCAGRDAQDFTNDVNFLSQQQWGGSGNSNLGPCHQAFPHADSNDINGNGNLVGEHTRDYAICNDNYRLADLYLYIATLAPNAKIYIVGYPDLFQRCSSLGPAGDEILDLAPADYLDPRIDCADMDWLYRAGEELSLKIQSEVVAGQAMMLLRGMDPSRLSFIDTSNAGLTSLNSGLTSRHKYNDDVWNPNLTSFCPVIFKSSGSTTVRAESFHPNFNGQLALYNYIKNIVQP